MPLPLQSQRMALLQMILTVFISLMKITSARSLLVKPVAYGTKFSLNCQTVQNFNETLQELYWFKDGSMLLNASGINTYSVDNATFTDSGNYSCRTAGSTEYLQRTKVIVGRKPASPSPSVCFGSKSPMVTCTFYSGSQDEIKLCWEIANTNRYVWISGCEDYNVQQKNVTFLLEEPRLLLTTTVKNEFGNSNRTDRHEPIVKPDPPIIKRLFTTSIDTLNASFTIPRTWSTESWLNYKGNYTQNGIEGKLLEDFTRRKKEVFFSFTVERLPYSLVCLTMQIQNGILTPYMQVDSLPWSNFSKPMCSYTPMAAPSKSPIIYRVSVNQSQSESELRNITLSWHPPPPENRNGIIDHYELLTILHNKTILKYELPGNATNTKVVGVKSSKSYVFRLYAWTIAGRSPPFVYVLNPSVPLQKDVGLLVWLSILLSSIFLLAVFGRITCVIKNKLSASHLPEPYFIPEAKMNHYMSKKRPPPCQKEIFDDLKMPSSTDVICTEVDCYRGSVESSSPNESKSTTSEEFIRFASSKDEAGPDENTLTTSYESNEGASVYILSSTDAEASSSNDDPDTGCDVFHKECPGDESAIAVCGSPVNVNTEDYIPRDDTVEYFRILCGAKEKEKQTVSIDNEYASTAGIPEGNRQTSDACKASTYSAGADIECEGLQASALNEKCLPCTNMVTNMEYLFVCDKPNNQEAQHYANYVPFEARVHDTLSKLNALSQTETG